MTATYGTYYLHHLKAPERKKTCRQSVVLFLSFFLLQVEMVLKGARWAIFGSWTRSRFEIQVVVPCL